MWFALSRAESQQLIQHPCICISADDADLLACIYISVSVSVSLWLDILRVSYLRDDWSVSKPQGCHPIGQIKSFVR